MSRIQNTDLLPFVLNKQVDVCEYLIKQGINITAKNNIGGTSLHTAAKYEKPKCVTCLLDHGADALARTKFKDTPLHSAAVGGASKSIACLLDHGVDVNTKGSYKRSALTHAAYYGQVNMTLNLSICVQIVLYS